MHALLDLEKKYCYNAGMVEIYHGISIPGADNPGMWVPRSTRRTWGKRLREWVREWRKRIREGRHGGRAAAK